jgi:integrase
MSQLATPLPAKETGPKRRPRGSSQPGKLTAMRVAAIVKAAHPGYVADGGNLFLQISKGRTASWVFRFRDDGRLHEMGLGALHTITLAEARDEAGSLRKKLKGYRDGKTDLNPLAEKRAKLAGRKAETAKVMTFKQCGDAYFKTHQAEWRNAKHVAQWRSSLDTYVYPLLGELAVSKIDTALVSKVLEQDVDAVGGKRGPFWTSKTETASRVRGRIEMILDWARVRGYRSGENPARWRGHLDQMLAKPTKAKSAVRAATGRPEHFVAMSYNDVPAFMIDLRKRDAMSARALEFTVLTAKRTEEVLGARRREVDRDATVTVLDENDQPRTVRCPIWTIPAGRMKASREHRLPLSDAAVSVLEKVGCFGGDPDGYIFAGAKPGSPLTNILKYLQDDMGIGKAATVHGFRSSFRDWVAERTAFPDSVAEMALAHVISDKVEGAYRRGQQFEKRRDLAEAWSRYCAGPSGATVLSMPLRKAASE